jgi:hypothetical protein
MIAVTVGSERKRSPRAANTISDTVEPVSAPKKIATATVVYRQPPRRRSGDLLALTVDLQSGWPAVPF